MVNNVLVLLASYNGEKYIAQQIKTIFSQTNCNVSVLVSDDCSDDDTINILLKLKKKYKNIFILKNHKKFDHSGQNFYNLIINSNVDNFDYVAFADQDDLFHYDKFSHQISQMIKYACQASSSSVKCFGYSNKVLVQSPDITKYDFFFEGAGQGCSFLIKKDLFLSYKEFIIKNYNKISDFVFHDWLTYIYVRSNKYDWSFINKPLLNYRVHKRNSYGNKYSLRGIFIRIIKLFNGWYFQQVIMANKIARIIDPELLDLRKITLFQFAFLLITNGRRKISDRFISFIFLLLLRLFYK